MIIKACAKLNYALNIETARADGYHNLQMIMQSVDLCDTLNIEFSENEPLFVTCDIPIEGENLVSKAVAAYSAEIGKEIGGKIHIKKRIPLCGGLGGGSADAGAVLRALQAVYGDVSDERLAQIALSLGADVPFALIGGTKLAAGVGERLESLPTFTACTLLLASAGQKDSTGKMFARFDAMENKLHPDINNAADLIKNGYFGAASEHFKNSFYPLYQGEVTDKIERIMREFGAVCVSLSGAGPTMFGIFKKADDALKAKAQIEKFTWCESCRPTENSVIFE